jgi:segregation and condensation protein B
MEEQNTTISKNHPDFPDVCDVPTFAEISEKERRQQAKKIIEALLFASNEPLSIHKIQEILEIFSPFSISAIKEILEALGQFYRSSDSSFHLYEIAGGYILRTAEIYRPYVEKLHGGKRSEKISQATMEVLAIIAYRQPITKAQIEGIRGVDCSNAIHSLIERELIEQVGKSETPGRPSLYATTFRFLKHLGLKSLEELPKFTMRPFN